MKAGVAGKRAPAGIGGPNMGTFLDRVTATLNRLLLLGIQFVHGVHVL